MKWFWSSVLALILIAGAALPVQAQSTTKANDGWVLLPQMLGGTVGTFGGLVVGAVGGGLAGATACDDLPDEDEELDTFRDLVRVGKCVYGVLTSTLAGMAIGMPVGAALGVSMASPSEFVPTYLNSLLGALSGEMLGLGALYVVPKLLDMSWLETARLADRYVGFTLMATIAGSVIGSYFQ